MNPDNLEKSFYSRASMYSFFIILIVFVTMFLGTNQFKHIDLALSGYMVAAGVCFIGLTFRIVAFSMRPATKAVDRRSRKNLKDKKRKKRSFKAIAVTLFENIILQKFIFKRGIYRGIQHFLVAYGCMGSFIITFGLVFGWFHFTLVDPQHYAISVMGMKTIVMDVEGFLAFMIYNGLNWTGGMCLIGLCMMFYRRIKDRDLHVTQRFEFDIVPLMILLAVTVTGLALTASAVLFHGTLYMTISMIHQLTVVTLLIYFPFGKLFHFPIRPLATAVPMNYQVGEDIPLHNCKGCGKEYAAQEQIEDVVSILKENAFDLQLDDGSYLAEYCWECRRKMRAMRQMNLLNPRSKDPYAPLDTNTGISMPGFSKKKA
ncbi:MFS transporter [Aneurinibacillus tyrosinisolvens]|uniref:MFS transporter n=1 Tax=Aneurinibacillus tyrosinisolvens TaxID=1443435 RepID=UPI00063FA468|nr:MFS transporter [Aneurinibacillus tyrosinisolvens]